MAAKKGSEGKHAKKLYQASIAIENNPTPPVKPATPSGKRAFFRKTFIRKATGARAAIT
jgi:hypothetical protein